MNVHSQIRKEALAILKEKIPAVDHFINGRPIFTDIEKELPAIAVFIDESQSEEMTMCEAQWDGVLNIGIYLQPFMTEDALDDLAELVRAALDGVSLSGVETLRLTKFSYSYDEAQASWIAANLHYEISY